MSAICEKEFTLHVGSDQECIPTPLAYYKLDALDSGEAHDVMGSRNLAQGGIGSATVVSGKIGDAFSMDATTRYEISDATLMPLSQSFTVRLWFNLPLGGGGGTIFLISNGPGGNYLEVTRGLIGPNNLKLFIDLNTDVGLFSLITPDFTTGVWHRLVITYDNGNTLRVRVDDDADLTIAATGDIPVGASNLFRIAGLTGSAIMDEVYYKIGTIWTEGDLDSDWNDGDGLTYPCAGLVEYWKFDSGPTYPAEINSDLNLSTVVGTPTLGVGILNNAMQISGIPVNTVEGVSTNAGAGNTKIVIETGFTFTTWVNWTSFGTTASFSEALRIAFFDSVGAAVVNFAVVFGPGPPPIFPGITKNGLPLFFPSMSFGTGIWNFLHLQFDFSTKKFGFQRGHPIFGLSGIDESVAIADDLSTITQGIISLRGATGHTISTSPDYVQDESGFWTRLLTPAEVNDLWGGGTPPAYPAIPQ